MSKILKPITMEQLDEWIKALRSGKYEQTTGTLCERDYNGYSKYCCLGVLAEINNEHSMLATQGYLYTPEGADPELPCYLTKPTQDTLADMNDQGFDFAHIADYIEQNKETIYNDAQTHSR